MNVVGDVMCKAFRFALSGMLVITGVGVLSGCSDAWSRAQIDLVSSFVDYHDDDEGWPYLNAVDITALECAEVGCEQAVQSPYVSVLKFPSVSAAAEFEKGCDCYAIDPIVVRFDGTPVSEKERRDIIYSLSNINAGSAD